MTRTYVDPDDVRPVSEDGEFVAQQDEQTEWPEPPTSAAYSGVLGEIALLTVQERNATARIASVGFRR